MDDKIKDALRLARQGFRRGGAKGPSSGEVVGWTPEKEAMAYNLEQKYKLPEGYLKGMSFRESHFGRDPNRPGSQFQSEYQLGKDIRKGVTNTRDFGQSANAAAKYAAENQAKLQERIGREPTLQELYMAHQQGARGAGNLITHPNASAASQIGAKFARANNGLGLTSQEFINKHSKEVNQGIQEGAKQLWENKGASPQMGDVAMLQKGAPSEQAMQVAGLQGSPAGQQMAMPTQMALAQPPAQMPTPAPAPVASQGAPAQVAKAELPPSATLSRINPADPSGPLKSEAGSPPAQMAKAELPEMNVGNQQPTPSQKPSEAMQKAPEMPASKPAPTHTAQTKLPDMDVGGSKPPQMAAEINIGKPPQQSFAGPETPQTPPMEAVAQSAAPDEASSQSFLADQGINQPEPMSAPEMETGGAEMPDMTAGLENMFMADGGSVGDGLESALKSAKEGHYPLHQGLARHGYATDGAVEREPEVQAEGEVSFAPEYTPRPVEQPHVPDEASQEAFIKQHTAGSAPQYDPRAETTLKNAGIAAAKWTPPGAAMDAMGMMGGPSMVENVRQGRYLPAAAQAFAVGLPAALAGRAAIAAGLGAGASKFTKLGRPDVYGMPTYVGYQTAEDWAPSVVGKDTYEGIKKAGKSAVDEATKYVKGKLGYAGGGEVEDALNLAKPRKKHC